MAAPTSDALSPDSLLSLMTKTLPKPEDGSAQPLIKDQFAAIALFCHTCVLAVGFRLVGLGEDHTIESQPEPKVDKEVRPLPRDWSAASAYAFRYSHLQTSTECLLKVSRLGGKALVFGTGLGDDDKTASFEVTARDYISEDSVKQERFSADSSSALRNIFISNSRIGELANLVETRIIQKIALPNTQKAGHEDNTSSAGVAAAATAAATAAREQPRRDDTGVQLPEHADPSQDDNPAPATPYPFNDPLVAAPRQPQPVGDFAPPDFEDEYELNTRPKGTTTSGSQPFGNIGERDLYPPGLAPHDPLRIGPGLGGGYRGGGGMHPTFDDPIFGGGIGGTAPFDPRAPPGARYDPIGPGRGPPSLRGGSRFPGGGRGGFGGNPFSGYGSGDFI